MATILRGKKKGQHIPIHQWCNDWFMLEDSKIYSPMALQLDPAEMEDVLAHKNNGIMFALYDLLETGKFKKKGRV